MRRVLWTTILTLTILLSSGTAFGAAKKYQVTGTVLEVSDKMIVVQKNDEKWEIDRTADTEVKGDLKVGAKVTVFYRMAADTIEVK